MGDRRKCQTYTASPAEPGGLPVMLVLGRERTRARPANRGRNERDHLMGAGPTDRHFPILKRRAISTRFRNDLKTVQIKKERPVSWCCEVASCALAANERSGNDQLSNRIESLSAIGVDPDKARMYRHHSKSGPVA